MKKFIILFWLMLIKVGCFAQGLSLLQIDSLKNELKIQLTPDSNRVKLFIILGNELQFSDAKYALALTDSALLLSKQIKWQSGIKKSIRQLGVINMNSTEYGKAMDYFQMALNESEGSDDEMFRSTIFNNMAMIYLAMGDFRKAVGHFVACLQIAEKHSSDFMTCLSLNNIGLSYIKMGIPDSAIQYLERAIPISEKNSYQRILSVNYTNLGIALNKIKKYDLAFENFKKGIYFAELAIDITSKSQALLGLSEVMLFRKDYPLARTYALDALKLSQPLELIQYKADSYKLLTEIYMNLGKYKESLTSHKSFLVLKDSIMNEEKKSDLIKKDLLYEFEKKQALSKMENEMKVALATEEAEHQKARKNIIALASILVFLSGIGGFIIYKRRRDIIELKNQVELKLEVSEVEMKALRAQMNPHFIFNSLNSISDYVAKNDNVAADIYLTKFAKIMRMILENSQMKSIPLEDDLKVLELYMQLESLRNKEKFVYEIIVDPKIDPYNTLVPPLLLQPFVENSIWHGISKLDRIGKISIKIEKSDDNFINCIVEDNGIGRIAAAKTDLTKQENKKSLGLRITKSRIEILNKIKNTNASIQFKDLAEGFRVEVSLPLQLSY